LTVLSIQLKHILLLEDNGGVSSVLGLLLEDANYHVTSLERVAGACEILEREKSIY